MFKKVSQLLLLCLFLIPSVQLMAQQKMVQKVYGSGDAFLIHELKAFIETDNKTAVVQNIFSSESKKDEGMSLKKGDKILMVNGKRVKSVKDIEDIYSKIKPEEEVKLGVSRNEEMFIVSFTKEDVKNAPGQRVMMMTQSADGKVTAKSGKPGETRQMVIHGESDKMAPLMEIGLVIKEENNQVVVAVVLPDAKKVLGEDIKNGDILIFLNKTKIKTVKQFSKIYDKLDTGASVKMIFKRDDKNISCTYEKPVQQNFNIQK